MNETNSFYEYGGTEILTVAQDEKSNLYKIYLATNEHYVVSREFDKSKGMYGNAPDSIICKGLMDFSDSIKGAKFSIYKIMDMFIDRCFDERAFDTYTQDAIWLTIDYPSYIEMEEILNTYSSRIRWYTADDTMGEYINTILYKYNNQYHNQDILKEFKDMIIHNGIKAIFINKDAIIERVLTNDIFSDIPIFIGEFSEKNPSEFIGFKYFKH